MAINHKYKPSETKAGSWEEIEKFYNDLISSGWPLQEIMLLVQYIRNNNNFNQKLFSCTFMDKLIISISDPRVE